MDDLPSISHKNRASQLGAKDKKNNEILAPPLINAVTWPIT